MAYNKKELEKQAVDAIRINNLMFANEVWVYLGISERTYYNLKMQELQSVKEALRTNKIKTKGSLKAKWYKSNNATLQVALMKLIADDDERKRLSQQYTDVTTQGEKVQFINDVPRPDK